jgi:hypothetical protein
MYLPYKKISPRYLWLQEQRLQRRVERHTVMVTDVRVARFIELASVGNISILIGHSWPIIYQRQLFDRSLPVQGNQNQARPYCQQPVDRMFDRHVAQLASIYNSSVGNGCPPTDPYQGSLPVFQEG